MIWNIFKKLKQDKEIRRLAIVEAKKKFWAKDHKRLIDAGFTEQQIKAIKKSIINHILLLQ